MRSDDSDFLAGAMFFLFGLAMGIASLHYGLGSGGRLGAGAFPAMVGGLLAVIGMASIAKALRSGFTGPKVLPFDLRSLACITLALLFGALTLRSLGVAIAVPGTVAIAGLAARELRPVAIILTAAFLTVFTYVVFIASLGVRLPVMPGGF